MLKSLAIYSFCIALVDSLSYWILMPGMALSATGEGIPPLGTVLPRGELYIAPFYRFY
jgi:hypothetical protein